MDDRKATILINRRDGGQSSYAGRRPLPDHSSLTFDGNGLEHLVGSISRMKSADLGETLSTPSSRGCQDGDRSSGTTGGDALATPSSQSSGRIAAARRWIDLLESNQSGQVSRTE
jgi:hypothetical protein